MTKVVMHMHRSLKLRLSVSFLIHPSFCPAKEQIFPVLWTYQHETLSSLRHVCSDFMFI